MTKTIRIRRTDGSLTEYTASGGEYTTILDALERFRADRDPSLLYRHSCHHGSCGTCGAIANGRRILMCTTRLANCEDEITLEPLSPFPVLGDLAVDPTPLYADFPRDADYLRPSEAQKEAVPPAEVPTFVRFENCIECGLCESACPIEERFIGPAALAAYNRELEKHPERAEEILNAVGVPHGAPRCDRALACSRVCPLGVYPAKHIAVLNRKLEKRD